MLARLSFSWSPRRGEYPYYVTCLDGLLKRQIRSPESSNSARSTGPAPAPPHFRGQCSARYTVIPNFNFHFFSLSCRHHSVCQTAFRV